MEVYLILAVSIALLAAVLLRRHRGQSGIGRENAGRKPEDAGKDKHLFFKGE